MSVRQGKPGQAARMTRGPALSRCPEALVVAASTGGLQALSTLLASLGATIARIPVFVVLHMPVGFEASVTAHIARISRMKVRAAIHGEAVRPGLIYFAPPERHLELAREKGVAKLVLHDGPAINFCKPSADHLFRSAAEVYGRAVIAVVLSGMGADGCAGAAAIVEMGGHVLAQDEESSAVWGMPAAVVEAGHAMAAMPLEDIAGYIGRALLSPPDGAAA